MGDRLNSANQDRLWTRDFSLGFGSYMLFWASYVFVLSTLPLYMVQRLGLSSSQVGLVGGLLALAALLVRVVSGYALDRWGRRWIYVSSLAAFMVAALGFAFTRDLLSLAVVRFVYGIPFGVVSATGTTIAGDLSPRSRRGEAVGIFLLAYTVMLAAGPALAVLLLAKGQFARVFAASGLLALIGALLAACVRFPHIRAPQARFGLASAFDRRALPAALLAGFQGLGYGSVMSFISLYGQKFGLPNVGLFYLVYALGQAASRSLAGKAFDREGPRRIIPLGYCLLMAGYSAMGLWRTPSGFLTGALAYGLGWALTWPSLQSMAIEQAPPARRGAASCTVWNGFDLGIFVGSYALGAVAQRTGNYSSMYLASAGILIVPLALALAWVLPHYRPWQGTE